MAAPIAGLSMPSSIPIPVAATMKGSEGGCQAAPLTYHRPVQGGRNPAGEQQGKKEHGHQRERRPAGEKCSHVELHSAGYEEEWDEDTEADGLELRVEAGMRHHLVAI